MRIKRGKELSDRKIEYEFFSYEDRKLLPYWQRPFECKLGLHEYDSIYNGRWYYVGCIRCFRKHPFYTRK